MDVPEKLTAIPCPQYHSGVDYECLYKLIPELSYMDGAGTIYADEVVKRYNEYEEIKRLLVLETERADRLAFTIKNARGNLGLTY